MARLLLAVPEPGLRLKKSIEKYLKRVFLECLPLHCSFFGCVGKT